MDFLRARILTGFPWNLWAYTWSWVPETLQFLPILGFFSFNLICIIFYCSPLLLIFAKKFNLIFFTFIVIIFFGNFIYGSSIIKKNDNFLKKIKLNPENSIYTKIISPNFDIKYNSSDEDISKKVLKLIKYSEPDINKKTLFIWPEGVFTGFNFDEIKQYKNIFEKNFSKNHLILFGINTVSDNQAEAKTFNSLLIINNKFDILFKYDKTKLVPFGEFLPFENFLNNFGLKKITEGHGSFSRGSAMNIFTLEELKLLPLICYEIIFPELSQNQKTKNLIVNISEDAWFGKTIGPSQHLAKAIFRSIENNTFLARSANKGFSAFIDNKGIIKNILKPNEIGVIELNVPLLDSPQIKYKIDLIFFVLLFTCIFIFLVFKKNENK